MYRHILVLVVVLFLVSACQGGPRGSVTDDDFRTGTQAVALNFERNAPPNQIISGDTFSAALTLENRGAADVRRGIIILSTDESILSLSGQNRQSFSLEGKSRTYPRGESDLIVFGGRAQPLTSQSQRQDTQLIATVCYDYQTYVFEDVCIDMDPYNQNPHLDRICQTRTISPGGRGGPVGVRTIDVRYEQQDQRFVPIIQFEIAKLGSGFIYEHGRSDSYCGSRSFGGEANLVQFDATLSDIPLDCQGLTRGVHGYFQVELRDGSARVSCFSNSYDRQFGSYVAPLSIDLRYGHTHSVSRQVSIVR
ncbi:MAG: hypothetical protein ACMXYF_00565 [Candidatus Woesearchaeota archaeon]